ncbi:hypothetical protein [Polaribacter porphyrae]|uniref:hypothetical protein n=1 Tax=Polaribacter porphyrae TaxID=1137780 RepID=UPI0014731D0D|nr:hypothetical protein [Polaribacter porphyrae]
MKKITVKKVAFIAICILSLISFSSCRSTSSSCGLAENITIQPVNQQADFM